MLWLPRARRGSRRELVWMRPYWLVWVLGFHLLWLSRKILRNLLLHLASVKLVLWNYIYRGVSTHLCCWWKARMPCIFIVWGLSHKLWLIDR